MTNAEIASLLNEMAALLRVAGADPFRIRAYDRAAEAVASHGTPVARLPAKELIRIPGVGESMAAHIADCASTGGFPKLAALRRRFPSGLREMLRLPGLGPKRARFLFDHGIASVGELRAALDAGAVAKLKGFGPKVEENLRRGLDFRAGPERVIRTAALRLAAPLVAAVRAFPGVSRAEMAGSLRRGRETVGDLDVVAAAADGPAAIARFVKLGMIERVLAEGPTKASVTLAGGMQCDLRVVPERCFGAALLYFTGSKDHNIVLRAMALKRGLTLNEYGVFRLSDKKLARPLAGRTEEEVYAALGLSYIEPELRENRGEVDAALAGRLPRLVTAADLKGDFHNHSAHTDGRDSLEAMARAARERGWEWTALGDHSRSLKIANGLSVERLRETFAELEEVRGKVPGIELLRSMEVDVLADGSMDYPDEVLDEIDVVVASVHSRFKQPAEEMTARLARAASNRRVDILGHLTGRLINRRPGYGFDAEAVLAAAAGAGTAVEINGQPDRQDADDVNARRARALGAPLALDSDAHSAREFGCIENAVVVARRAWLEPKDVLNCLGRRELRDWLSRR